MKTKRYPQEKREIIAKLTFEQLTAFVKEVSPDLLDKFIERLPVIQKGFRKGKKTELNRRLTIFLLRKEIWNDDDWSMFGDLWIDWIKTQGKLDKALSSFDNSSDFHEDPMGIPPNSELDIQCFQYLALKSEEARIPRKLIKQFYDFGYFIPDPSIENYITISKSAAELELYEIPDKIKEIENTYKDFESYMENIQNKLELAEKNTEKNIEHYKKVDLHEVILTEIQDQSKKLEESHEKLKENIIQIQNNITQINSCYGQSQEELKYFQKDYENTVEDALEQIKILHQGFNSELIRLNEKLNSVEEFIKQETKILSPENVQHEQHVPIKIECLSVNKDQIQELETSDKFVSGLTNGLKNIGIQSLVAQIQSSEIIAALTAGQVVSFVGSMAATVAAVCARCLAAANIYRIRIPIGLTNNIAFDEIFLKVLENSEKNKEISALIIERMNLSAPETYAASLRQLITERFFRLNSRGKNLILFSTVVDGPSALDIPQEVCEWGPVFHTDCWVWRNKWSPRLMEPGTITSKAWEEWIDSLGDPLDDWEDIFVDFSFLDDSATVLWKRSLYLASAALSKEKIYCQLPNVIQSLAFGWLLPYGLAAGLDIASLDNVLTEGQIKDDRAAKFLRFTNIMPREL